MPTVTHLLQVNRIRHHQLPSKRELVKTLKTKTNQEAAVFYGVGYKTFVRWLKYYDIWNRVFSQEMLSLADAARKLNVSRMTMSNWYRKGEIPGAVKINETRVLVPQATVNMLMLLRGNHN